MSWWKFILILVSILVLGAIAMNYITSMYLPESFIETIGRNIIDWVTSV